MREISGILLFDADDIKKGEHEAIKALESVSFGDVHMPHGFRLIEHEGKKYIEPMEKSEWLELMKAVNPNFDHDSSWARTCIQTSPTSCRRKYCGNGYSCTRMFNPNTQQYWCGCA